LHKWRARHGLQATALLVAAAWAVLLAAGAPVGAATPQNAVTLRFPILARDSPPTPTATPTATATPIPTATATPMPPAACPGAVLALPRTGWLGWVYRQPCAGDGGCPASGVHHGIDIGSPAGSPVYAAYGGIVRLRSSVGVNIRHPELGISTYYTHMSNITVGVGSTVIRGQTVGYLQDMGPGQFNHVHFSVLREFGSDLELADTRDPSDYLNANVSIASGSQSHARQVQEWCRNPG